MRLKTPLIAGALCVVSAVPAQACFLPYMAMYQAIPASPMFGAAVAFELGDYTYFSPTAYYAMRLGNSAVVTPGIGVCSGEGSTDPFFGSALAFRLTSNENMTLNLQTGLSYLPFDGGSEMTIPIGAAARFTSSGPMSFYAGATLLWQNFDVDGFESVSETDPLLFGGVSGTSGSIGWTLGGMLKMGDGTDFAIVGGINMNQASNAIRNFFRR